MKQITKILATYKKKILKAFDTDLKKMQWAYSVLVLTFFTGDK